MFELLPLLIVLIFDVWIFLHRDLRGFATPDYKPCLFQQNDVTGKHRQ